MLIIKDLKITDYSETFVLMKDFTITRDKFSPDELWILEHLPVYTQGQAGRPEHLLNPKNIPVIQSDRGGQVTYHGPGQLLGYVLINLKRKNLNIRTLVCNLEKTIITLLKELNIYAQQKCKAPGVYVNDQKIASIGLRVKNGYSYHGIALNVDMDLSPFKGINPCGFQLLQMTQIKDFVETITMQNIKDLFIKHFKNIFDY